MIKKLSPDFLSYSQIEKIAKEFSTKYNPKNILPVPIEEIVELQLGIKITAIEGLKRNFDIDGFINTACNEISLDHDMFMKYIPRSRWTMAHEIGHKILHEKIYCDTQFQTPEEYETFLNRISEEDYKWLERQAHAFASYVLVPTDLLKIHINKKTPLVKVLDLFGVSMDTLVRRIQKEKITLPDLDIPF